MWLPPRRELARADRSRHAVLAADRHRRRPLTGELGDDDEPTATLGDVAARGQVPITVVVDRAVTAVAAGAAVALSAAASRSADGADGVKDWR